MKKLQFRIDFENMDRSLPLEQHILDKIQRLEKLIGEDVEPSYVEVWVKAYERHPHHEVDIQLKAGNVSLHSHDEGTDMYVAADSAVDKIVKLYKKEKERFRDKLRKRGEEGKEDLNSET